MIEKTTLSSGVDIPFIKAQLTIHPPKIKEIAMIGESNFFVGTELLNSRKKVLQKQGNFDLEDLTNFDIIMSVINDKSSEGKQQKQKMFQVLGLLFPQANIQCTPSSILIINKDDVKYLDKENYDDFQLIITDLFMLDKRNKEATVYNPSDDKANAIAEKLYKAREKVAKEKGEDRELFLLGKYADILSVGLQLDRNILNEYTVWQLYSTFDRYMAKVNWDINMQCRLAGATKVEEVKNWME